MFNSEFLFLGPHDVPGDGNSVLAIDHTEHQRHQIVLLGSRIRGQHQRLLRQGDRILAAVQAQQRALPATGPARLSGGPADALSTGGGFHTMQGVDTGPHAGVGTFG